MPTLVVQKDRIIHNLRAIEKETGVTVIPVLKGNAYGLGDCQTAKVLADSGVNLIAASRLEEAERIAATLAETEILLLAPYSTEAAAEKIVGLGLTAAIGSYESAVLLNGIAEKNGVKCRVHIKFDTGMGRFGFLPEEADKAVQAARYLKNLTVTGCFSHFSNAFGKDKKGILKQLELFNRCTDELRKTEIDPGLTHIANSAAALLYPGARLSAVRAGSALLGRLSIKNKLGLKKVGRFDSEVCETRWLPAGHNIGYANTFTTRGPTKIAVIPAGYADGLFVQKIQDTFRFRDILRYGWHDFKLIFRKPKLYCEINGEKAPLLGIVGLCSVIADVSSIQCDNGDTASFDVNPLFINDNVPRTYI